MAELLDTIVSPADLPQVARELRAFLLRSVAATGGHLSSNLGTVELTVALHHVFNTPHDRLVWDVGHQTYPHKILTGRRDRMPTLRQIGGISGFPRREESAYDTFGTAHSSTSISAGLACEGLKPVVAIYSTFLQRAYDQLIHDVALQNLPVVFALSLSA